MPLTQLEYDETSEAIQFALCQAIGVINTVFQKEFARFGEDLWTARAMLKSGVLNVGGKTPETLIDEVCSDIEAHPVTRAKEYFERLVELLEKAGIDAGELMADGSPGEKREIQLFNIMDETNVGDIFPLVFGLPTALTSLLEHWRTRLTVQVLSGGDIAIAGYGTYPQDEVLRVASQFSCFMRNLEFEGGVNWGAERKPWLAFQESALAFGTRTDVEKVPQKFMDGVIDIVKEHQQVLPSVTICAKGWVWRYDPNVCEWLPEMKEPFSIKIGLVMPRRLEQLLPSCVYHSELGILVFGNTFELLKNTLELPLEVWGLQFCFCIAEFYRRQDEVENGSLLGSTAVYVTTTEEIIKKYGEGAIRDLLNSIVLPFGNRTMAKFYDSADIEELKPHIPTILFGFNLFKEARERKRALIYLDELSTEQQAILNEFAPSELAVAISL